MSQHFQQIQSQSQNLVLAPQLRQSLKILQVPTLELRNVILEELQINPTLEELPMEGISIDGDGSDSQDQHESEDSSLNMDEDNFEIFNKLDDDWREYFAQENSNSHYSAEAEESRKHFFDSIVGETSLQEHLIRQARLLELSDRQLKAIEYLIGSLDDRGFLTISEIEVQRATQVPAADIGIARQALLTLDPPGIGSRNLQECLLTQLQIHHREHTLAATLVRDYFDLLIKRRIPDLIRKTGSRADAIETALEVIAELDPAPGRKFSGDDNRIVVPDVRVEKNDFGEWQVILNHEYIPRLRLNQHYKDMIAAGTLSTKEKDYLREQMRSGKFLIHSIEQRLQTIEKITWQLLRFQKEFFEQGLSKLKPLTMQQIANELGVHETTVSRAIANKYIDTPHGLLEMKFFFTSGYQSDSGETVANTTIKERIHQMIQAEDPVKPLSDQEIVRLLGEENIQIARRTVAKYREEMNILPTHLRRRYS
jgi:RNA polymerase sigma-54 factor